jgi:hypothetical protein
MRPPWPSIPEVSAAMVGLARVGASLAPNHAGAHLVLGAVQIHTNRTAQGMAESKRALALDRNLVSAHAQIGLAKLLSVARQRLRPTSMKHCASLPAISPRSFGCSWPRAT